MKSTRAVLGVAFAVSLLGSAAAAADRPAIKSSDYIMRDFHFHTGGVLPELRIHYLTIGDPSGQPVLLLHGTGGSGASFLSPECAGELFGPGQPLDPAKYFIIMPDGIGTGQSSKPSEGLRTHFPHYNYDDMVTAQYRLVTERFRIHHLRLVMGNSMGGMHTWMWGEKYPGMMDALVPMASQPSAMAGRNWMLRRMLIETIKADPAYKDGDYIEQPGSLRIADTFYGIATSGGSIAWQALAPTRGAADALVEARLNAVSHADANDTIWQWDASRDYDALPDLDHITAPVLAINSADDERNPPETGLMARDIRKLKQGRVYLIPASAETRGHGTTGDARFWAPQLRKLLARVPPAKS